MLANDETLQLIYEVLDKKGFIDIPSFGFSMYPYIQKGDLCRFVPVNKNSVKKGDVVLYIDSLGKLIGHRFFDRTQTKDGMMFLCKGDSNLSYDMRVHFNQIIGKLVLIQRNEKIIESTDLRSRVWGSLMVNLPILSRFLQRIAEKKHKELLEANVHKFRRKK